MTFEEMQQKAYDINEAHGFHENYNVSEKLLLAVGEISEAVEELRDNQPTTRVYYKDFDGTAEIGYKPEGFPIELADTIIRLMDIAAKEGIDLAAAIRLKLAYNETRPFKHGRKF